jgi:TetR/AcrR family transcriptional repressor of nem operon
MPRTKTFDEQQALEKAMHTFWRKGYHATSMQDLVDAMGINRASLYDTFGGKKDLFDQAFELYRKTNTQGLQRFLEQQDSVRDGFRQLFAMAIAETQSEAGQKGCFVVNVTTELLPDDRSMEGVIRANKEGFTAVFHQFLQQGVASGELSADQDLEAAANLFFTLYNGVKVVGKIPGQEKALLGAVEAALGALR